MNPKTKEKLERLADLQCWEDDEDFAVEDYAGANLDDAYVGGRRSGQIMLAREILGMPAWEETLSD